MALLLTSGPSKPGGVSRVDTHSLVGAGDQISLLANSTNELVPQQPQIKCGLSLSHV